MKYHPEKLLQLARLLLPDDPELAEEVCFSMKNPEQYLDHHFIRDSEPISNLPWFALIHGLSQRNLILTISEDMISTWFSKKRERKAKRFAWVIRDGKWSESFCSYSDSIVHPYVKFSLQLANHYLEPLHYVLCSFTPTLRPYTLTILPAETATACQELALESGYGILWIEKSLKLKPKPHYQVLAPAFLHLLENDTPFLPFDQQKPFLPFFNLQQKDH
ncbi:DUF6630 family protein [Thermoactinomyces mirandus]|uniref:DUF6630 domain-containing protein n=1 Tax=Thermoactinomyces mirandus TaxID=2756294 RepID=A0A7W2AQR4_9BACL|nr:hypothetical protein [Thermoactinomyces mirandus]MBA4601552.1 hypothetical protein [Thermoactinomyces mirandus]